MIPADAWIVAGTVDADESAMTGKWLPVTKGPGEDLYSGTDVSRGHRRRRCSPPVWRPSRPHRSVSWRGGPPEPLPGGDLLDRRDLIAIAMALVAVIASFPCCVDTAWRRRSSRAGGDIASIPVALPAVLSVTMAVGARDLAKRQAVVSRLRGRGDVGRRRPLCRRDRDDHRNELAIADVGVVGEGISRDQILREAALTVEQGGSDPIDTAILEALGGPVEGCEVLDFEPFDADRKRAEALVREVDAEYRVAKGAVQAILDLSGEGDSGAERVSAATAEFARRGQRALAVARADGGAWRLTGVLAIADPPREDSRETLEQARALGLEIKMVTGDRVEIAHEIAAEVGMGEEVLEAGSIEALKGEALTEQVEEADGFAQVVPEDK